MRSENDPFPVWAWNAGGRYDNLNFQDAQDIAGRPDSGPCYIPISRDMFRTSWRNSPWQRPRAATVAEILHLGIAFRGMYVETSETVHRTPE